MGSRGWWVDYFVFFLVRFILFVFCLFSLMCLSSSYGGGRFGLSVSFMLSMSIGYGDIGFSVVGFGCILFVCVLFVFVEVWFVF